MKIFDKMSVMRFGMLGLALICFLAFKTGISYGKNIYLQAGVVTIPAGTISNPSDITMWGFSRCDSTWTSCGPFKVPGPTLTATEGQPLHIHLKNALAGPYVEPTSVIIPGQPGGNLTPTWTDNSTGNRTDPTQRVRSFTAETPADNTTLVTYSWHSVKAGTYLYQSGTHPAVQVQMGLYGPLIVYPAAAGQAYPDPSSAFDNEVSLLFSEIDPVLHDAVATGNYGPGTAMTSTIDYHPKYFLINGLARAYPLSTQAGVRRINAGGPGQKLLLRFLNAGLEPKVPVVLGPYMSVIAEDGNFMTAINAAGTVIPVPKEQYSILLPPGKTVDAIMTPGAAGFIPVYDRRLNLSNAGMSPGGMLVYLRIQ